VASLRLTKSQAQDIFDDRCSFTARHDQRHPWPLNLAGRLDVFVPEPPEDVAQTIFA